MLLTEEEILNENELRCAAGGLLVSSTMTRYARIAKQAASISDLRGRMLLEPGLISALIETAYKFVHRLLVSDCRKLEEVYVAIVLTILTDAADPKIDDLLEWISLRTEASLTWSAALARKLRSERTGNMFILTGCWRDLTDLFDISNLDATTIQIQCCQ